MVLVHDVTFDAVRVILRHKKRENRALLVWTAARVIMLVMEIVRTIKSSTSRPLPFRGGFFPGACG